MSLILNAIEPTVAFLAGAGDVILSTGSAGLANKIRTFLGPIILLIISGISLTFLFRRQMMQFLTFFIIAVLVSALFYSPEIIENLGKWFGQQGESVKW